MKTGYVVADAMTTKPITSGKDISVQECAQLMKKHDVGSILIMEDQDLAGIITEKDLVQRIIAPGLPLDSPIENFISTDLITIAPHQDILDAMKLLEKHDLKRLPVIENEKFVGLLTMKTILKIEPQLFELIADRIELRGINPESPLLESFDQELSEGQCESCGSYSSRLIDDMGKKLCSNCHML